MRRPASIAFEARLLGILAKRAVKRLVSNGSNGYVTCTVADILVEELAKDTKLGLLIRHALAASDGLGLATVGLQAIK